jgi:hypothetical protein
MNGHASARSARMADHRFNTRGTIERQKEQEA